MGVWGAGFLPLDLDHGAIRADMQAATLPWFTAHVRVLDPKFADQGAYDPISDTTPPPADPDAAVVFDSGPRGALIQPANTKMDRGTQEADAVNAIRVQTTLPPGVVLRAGLRLKVVDGGNFPQLASFEWAVQEAIGSSLQWGAIIHCTAVG